MNGKKKFPDIPVALLLFIAMSVMMWVYSPYRIGFKEQVSIFLWSPDRLSWYLSNPAVLAQIAGDWITQFYYNNTTGVLVSLLLLIAIWIGLVRIARLSGSESPCLTVCLLPVIIAGAFIIWPNYPVSGLIGLLVSVWMACAVGHIKNDTLRAVAVGAGIPVLFVLAGGHALTFGLACCFLKNGKFKSSLMSVIPGLIIMLIVARFYNLTSLQALLYPVVPDYILPSPQFLLLLPVLIIVCQVAASRNLNLVPGIVSSLSSVVLLLTVFNNNALEFSIKIGTLAYRNSDWNEIRECANRNLDVRYGLFYRNLSYAREGRLPDALLKCFQGSASDGLFLSTGLGDPYLSMFYYTDALLEMGDLSQATDCALLGQTIMPGYYSTRMLRRLAEISVTAGDYEVASKYLQILSRTRNHKQWADNLLECMAKDSIPDQYLIWRSRASETDRFFGLGDMRSSLRIIADNSPMNKVAIDYLLCSYLLEKNLGTFINLYERYYMDKLDRYVKVPDLYQEALLLNVNSDESLREAEQKYHLSEDVVNRYLRFLKAQSQSDRGPVLTDESEGTYWEYIMTVRLTQNNQ